MLIRGESLGLRAKGLFGGDGQGTGAGSSRADGATILSSKGSMTLRSLSGSLAHVEDGESPFLPSSPQVIRGGTRCNAQPPAWLDLGLTNVTLGDNASQQQQLPTPQDHSSQDREDVLPPPLQLTRGDGWGRRCYLC
jgi:hypothetical protein